MKKEYLPRLIEEKIQDQMEATGCIVIEGPKWCGKSTTAKRFAKTVVELQMPKTFERYKVFATTSEGRLLEGEKPLMFDEWQKIPELWDYIRHDLDNNGGRGKFLLTGSAKPIEDPNRHSGAGRMAKIIMRPMSLWESGESSGQISLKDIFAGNHKISGDSKINFEQIAYVICRGGWPEVIGDSEKVALRVASNYYQLLTDDDITDVDKIKRDPERARRILRSYARNISSLASNKTIKLDIARNDSVMDEKTLASYMNALRKLFVIEDVLPWTPFLRSKTTIRAANKRQFVDPSLAAVALGATPNDLLNDMNTFGLLFESLCVRDLRIYADKLNGTVYHYHDTNGLEADAIVHLNNGDWGAVEIKLGGNHINDAAANLLKLKNRIDEVRMKAPKFLMVLTGLNYGYCRPDGVLVVPIGCLKD